jgi:hypothetical protein
MHEASRRHRNSLAEHRGNLAPAVDPAQLDLPAYHRAERRTYALD